MPYIDATYFNGYTTTRIDNAELAVLINRAEDVINTITMYRIGGDAGLALLLPFVQEQVKKATAAQVETMFAQGGIDTVTGNGAGAAMQSVGLGRFSYSSGASAGMQMINGIPLSPLVNTYLAPTGLLYRGMQCYG